MSKFTTISGSAVGIAAIAIGGHAVAHHIEVRNAENHYQVPRPNAVAEPHPAWGDGGPTEIEGALITTDGHLQLIVSATKCGAFSHLTSAPGDAPGTLNVTAYVLSFPVDCWAISIPWRVDVPGADDTTTIVVNGLDGTKVEVVDCRISQRSWRRSICGATHPFPSG
jgi:hypothetical protein